MRFLKLTKYNSTNSTVHGKPVWINIDLVTDLDVGVGYKGRTPEEKALPQEERFEAMTYVSFIASHPDGSCIQVQETPEQILTLERNTR